MTGNRFLANGGTELNATSQLYDLEFRNYDPVLGRMVQLDPMASKYGSITPYNYSLNNPSNMNDPRGDDVEPQPPAPREYMCAQCWREGTNLALYMMVSGGGMNSMGFGWRPGTSGIAPGSGNNWADGMQYGDWSSNGGSQLFRNGLAMGFSNEGGRLYDRSEGRRREVIELNGGLGTWESRFRYDLSNYDGAPGNLPDFEFWNIFVPSKLNRRAGLQYNGTCPTCPGSNYIAGLSPGFTINPGSGRKDISDEKNYPGIKIYQTSGVVMNTAVTIPGVGIFISSTIKPGLGMTQMLQHEYGHFLDYKFSPDLNSMGTPSSWLNYMLIIGIPSAFDLMRGASYDEHHEFYTEKRADQWAEIWFGSNYKGK